MPTIFTRLYSVLFYIISKYWDNNEDMQDVILIGKK